MLSIEKAMEHSETGVARHRMVYDRAGKPVDYRFLAVNSAFEELTGLNRDNILEKKVTEVLPKITEDAFDWISFYGKIVREGGRKTFEQYSLPLDRWYKVEVFSSEPGCFTTLFSDITPEKQLIKHEKNLLNFSQHLLKTNTGETDYQAIADKMKAITGAVYVSLNLFVQNTRKLKTVAIAGIADRLSEIIDLMGVNPVNRTWGDVTERTEMIKDKTVTYFEHLHDLTRNRFSEKFIRMAEKIFRTGQVYIIKTNRDENIMGDFTLIFKKGQSLKNKHEACLFADIVGIFLQRQRAGKLSEKVFELSNDGLLIHDKQGNIKAANGRISEMYGLEKEAFVNKNVKDFLMSDEDKRYSKEKLKQAFEKGNARIEHRIKTVKGEMFISVSASIYERDNNLILASIRDITAQKHRERQLNEYQAKLELAMQNGDIGFWEWDLSTGEAYFSPTVYELLGYEEGEMGDNMQAWFELFHPVDRTNVLPRIKTYPENSQKNPEIFRMKCKSGDYKWVKVKGATCQWSDDGNPLKAVGVINDITELIEARQKAERTAKAKSSFLADMSHEIRTPLNGLIGFSELMKETGLNSTQKHFMEIISRSTDTLKTLINDILDLSKIDSDKLELSPEKMNLKKFMEETVSLLRQEADKKRIMLNQKYDQSLPNDIYADPLRLRQILLNLLSNAVKFTDRGHVTLFVEPVDPFELDEKPETRTLLFKVEDTGKGIKETNRQKIMEPFSQEDSQITKQYGGTGLGLAITKRLLQLMDSELLIESVEGKGSIFSFYLTLPVAESQTTDREETALTQDDVESSRSREQHKILVVEDDAINRDFMETALGLADSDITVLKAINGIKAVELFKKENPALVFMDIVMSGMDGYEATAKIREHDNEVPIIAVTANVIEGEREKCLAAGMTDYIPKPVSIETIKKMVDTYLLSNK